MKDILKTYNVSHETINDLKTFQNMVLEWNNKFNLISKSSENNIWDRHILDSLQLCRFIDIEDRIMYDFGSGAGFPAIVLAIVSKKMFPHLQITLIESIGKKVTFLNEVKKELNLNINIIQDRIENLKLPKADIIFSRGLASLDKLLEYAYAYMNKNTRLVFPKGEKWKEEVLIAEKKWIFHYQAEQSETNENSCILYIKNIRRK